MTTRDNKKRIDVVDIARQIDDQLRAGGPSEDILDPRNDVETQQTAADLSEIERQELKAAKAALYFLNRVRVDIDNQSNQDESSIIIPAADHSTVKSLETINGPADNGSEFTSLGRFEIIRPIGHGGFAKVFLARDPQLDRDVAIKVLKAHALLSDESRTRFEREAKAAAVLSHPAILPIYETGNVGPVTFIVSEFCPGSTLAGWFSDLNKQSDVKTASQIVAQLAEAVQHAHQRGVIHRDLKPANILVQEGDAPISQRLRITDFGLAKQLESDDLTITTEGAVVGTPAYMSPEQARGDAQIDGATDIFSLGTVLYELLTGQLPFKKTGNLSTLNAIAHDTPVSPRKINEAIPKDLEAICLKCLQKRPADRYRNAYSLADDLNAFLAGRRVAARHATRIERFVRWLRREPALAAALAFAFCSLVFGIALTGWQWQVAQSNLADSNLQRDRALTNVHRIQATVENVLDEYGNSLDENLYLNVTHRRIINEMLSVHKQLIDDEAQEVDVSESTIESYVKIARLHRKLGQYEQSREICRQARTLVDLAIENNPETQTELRSALIDIGVQEICVALNSGRHEQAEELARNGLACMQEVAPDLPQASAKTVYRRFMLYRHLGLALHGQSKFRENQQCMEKGMQYATKLISDDPVNHDYQAYYGVALQDLATAYRSAGLRAKSTELFENALTHFQELAADPANTDDHRYRIGFLHLELADAYASQQRNDDAVVQFSSSRQILEELVAERPFDIDAHNRLVHAITRLARFHEKIGDYDDAKSLHELGLQMAENAKRDLMKLRYQMFFRVDHVSLLIDHFANENDAWVNDDQIENLLDQAIEIGEAATIKYPADRGLAHQLAEAYRHKGRILHYRDLPEDAHSMFDRSAEIAIGLLRSNPDVRNSQDLAIDRANYAAKRAAEFSRFDVAKSYLLELATAAPNSVHVQFQTARYLSRLAGDHQRAGHSPDQIGEIQSLALNKLARAFELGFVNRGQFKNQVEWKPIRDSDAFKKLVDSNKAKD